MYDFGTTMLFVTLTALLIIVPITLFVKAITSLSRSILHTHYRAHVKPSQKARTTPNTHHSEAAAKRTVDENPKALSIGKQGEIDVETALRQLYKFRYFVFTDLIVPTGNSDLTLTQIDHVVLSRHGIFCIETKALRGNVYGYGRSQSWKQYVENKSYPLHNPYRQNKHHIRSLEFLLGQYLRAPIHSYIAFPYARKVVVDGRIEDMSIPGVIKMISDHNHLIYTDSDIEKIAKTLAHAATYRDKLRDRHKEEVRSYLEAKVAKTLKIT